MCFLKGEIEATLAAPLLTAIHLAKSSDLAGSLQDIVNASENSKCRINMLTLDDTERSDRIMRLQGCVSEGSKDL